MRPKKMHEGVDSQDVAYLRHANPPCTFPPQTAASGGLVGGYWNGVPLGRGQDDVAGWWKK